MLFFMRKSQYTYFRFLLGLFLVLEIAARFVKQFNEESSENVQKSYGVTGSCQFEEIQSLVCPPKI